MSATIESFSKTIRNVIVHKVQIDYNENVKNIIHGLEVLQNYYNIQDINNLSFINFAVFNIADSFVCIGVGLFALQMILEEIAVMKKEKAAKLAAAGIETEENAENDNQID